VLAAYFIFFPLSRVITLVPVLFLPWIVEIPAVIYLGLWFISQLFNGLLSIVTDAQAFGGVAWWAHIGGFLAGLVLALYLNPVTTFEGLMLTNITRGNWNQNS